MARTPLTLMPAPGTKRAGGLVALGMLGLASCVPVDGPSNTDGAEPVVGRLQFNDRIIDLTPSAFADSPGAVPRDAVGEVMADIDRPKQAGNGARDTDSRGRTPR